MFTEEGESDHALYPPQEIRVATTRKRAPVVATATVIALVLAALPFGAAFAHGNPNPTKATPATCYYYNKATNSHTYYSNLVYIGTYEVWVAENSCVPSTFEVGGYFDGSAGQESGCGSATVAISGSVNGVNIPQFGGATSSSFGIGSCPSYISWTSGTYGAQLGDKITGCNKVTYNGASQPTLCTSYTY